MKKITVDFRKTDPRWKHEEGDDSQPLSHHLES